MTPRAFFSLVVLGDHAYVHAGVIWDGDFAILNLITWEWTRLETGPRAFDYLLARGSETEIITSGGRDRVSVLDVEKKEWREEESLAVEFYG